MLAVNSCQLPFNARIPASATNTIAAATTTATAMPSPTFTPAPSLTPTVTFTPTPTDTPSPTATPIQPTVVPADTYSVWYHPDGGLYVGDQVSMEVIAPQNQNMDGKQARIQVDPPNGPTLGPVNFGGFGNGNRIEALFTWGWDTKGLQPGDHTLTYTILPDGPNFSQTVTLHPQSQVPPPEPTAHWASARASCCILNYITGTDAERD